MARLVNVALRASTAPSLSGRGRSITAISAKSTCSLPATTMLEQEDLVGSWGFNYVALNQRAIEPVGEARTARQAPRCGGPARQTG
jgi:anaerobic selenocysteine-containing dehydrogenase